MDHVAGRVFIFSILPIIIAASDLGLDRNSRPRERRLEEIQEEDCFATVDP
jgi:hypothetical protein